MKQDISADIRKTLIVIAGPTAIGKTALAIELAKHYNTEIISADSRQFYKEMSIGTAKPSEQELANAVHHFIGNLSVSDTYSAGDFEQDALSRINKIFSIKDHVILVGGSGLFLQAVTEGFDDLPKADESVREQLNDSLVTKGIEHLQSLLKELDPLYYGQVDLSNPQRIIRALEVCISTGQPFSSFRRKALQKRPFDIVKIALEVPREIVYERINMRVDKMMKEGLLKEVASLRDYRHLNALNTVGYSEIFEYMDGALSLEQAVAAIKQNTRRFAKRQLTWLRRDPAYQWFAPSQRQEIIAAIDNYKA